jgi:bifunctional non-homologous end joining protein LigD
MISHTIRTRVGLCTEGGADKEYRIAVIHRDDNVYEVLAHNGKRGRATTVARTETHTTQELAIKAADVLQASKEKKHYRFNDSNGETAPSPTPDRIDTSLRPQLQTPITRERAEELARDDEFFAQRKYDGEHLLVAKRESTPTTYANKLGFSTTVPAHIERAIANGPAITLSGELLSDGFVVYDILAENDVDIRSYPYEHRLRILQRHASSLAPGIVVAPTAETTEQKLALIATVDAERGEGLIFKRRSSGHTAGRKHADQFKFKRWKSATCIVLQHNAGVRSVRLGLLDKDEIEFVVGDVTVKANQRVPAIGTFVEVKYLDYRAGGKLTQPELLRERDDVTIADCQLDQLEGLTSDHISAP